LDPVAFPSATLAEFYRLALLLSGDVYSAQQLLATCLADVEAHIDQLRSLERRRCWMAKRMRQHCLTQGAETDPAPAAPRLIREYADDESDPEVLKIEAYILAQRFHQLPEPERSALAFFYLDLFETEEIADLLGVTLEELGELLARARPRLKDSMREAKSNPATT
jgi:DNA-directed RNA polymerase specialized sigma24 family protein